MQDQILLDYEEQRAALAQVYLELRLPLQAAVAAAEADLGGAVEGDAEAVAVAA